MQPPMANPRPAPIVPRHTVSQSRQGDRGVFLTSDDRVLTKQIEQTHIPDGHSVDVKPLFPLVEDILVRSTQAVDLGALPGAQAQKEAMEGRASAALAETIPDLPLIIERVSCEIASKCLSGIDAHTATLTVLTLLQHFSWESKVMLTLASFALTYGEFWLLAQIYSTNSLAKSMALIKQLPTVVEHAGTFRPQFDAINNLIKAMLDVTRCIVEFRELPSNFIIEEDPVVKGAVNYFPIAVYWTIKSAVGAAAQITTITSAGHHGYATSATESWELSNMAHKLNTICDHLRKTLTDLHTMIEEKREMEAYKTLKNILYDMIHIDNMKVLKALIYAKDDISPLHDGTTKRRVYLDVLRRKNVLLLISTLDISQEELSILEQIYNESRIHAYEIVWMPILDRSVPWTDQIQAQFETLQATMPWYSVHHPSIIDKAVVRFAREEWHFGSKPILVVLDPQGRVLCPNAIHMMWIWGSNAFPFTSAREETLWLEESWRLELLVDGIDPTILSWIREGKYIFMFGGADIEWIRRFTTEARLVAQQARIPLEMVYVGKSSHRDMVRKICAAIMIEKLSHCWQDLTMVWFFWTRLDSMLNSKIQMEKADDHSDVIIQEIKKLLSYDKDHGGWALLAKGSMISVNGPGSTALTTLKEYEMWKELAAKEGFEQGYGVHYRSLHVKEYPCSRFEFPTTGRIPKSLLCPECHGPMRKHASFICCHEGVLGQGEVAQAQAQAQAQARARAQAPASLV